MKLFAREFNRRDDVVDFPKTKRWETRGRRGLGGTRKVFEGFNTISKDQDQHKEEAVELGRSLYLP